MLKAFLISLGLVLFSTTAVAKVGYPTQYCNHSTNPTACYYNTDPYPGTSTNPSYTRIQDGDGTLRADVKRINAATYSTQVTGLASLSFNSFWDGSNWRRWSGAQLNSDNIAATTYGVDARSYLFGYDSAGGNWDRIQIDASGQIKVSSSNKCNATFDDDVTTAVKAVTASAQNYTLPGSSGDCYKVCARGNTVYMYSAASDPASSLDHTVGNYAWAVTDGTCEAMPLNLAVIAFIGVSAGGTVEFRHMNPSL